MNNRVFIIATAGLALVLGIVLIYLNLNINNLKQTNPEPINTVNPTPTMSYSQPQNQQNPVNQEDLPEPTFTGANPNQELPDDEIERIEQTRSLRNSVPINTEYFSIEYDYSRLKFIVTLTEPKTDSETQFNNWLDANYPKVRKSDFILR
ncbi:MAG: hypothetical protein KatS3mg091_430 [Patescibacteria group bacterium]|nr:MAG: hypothetical protein KatS3mg091_430 [Patescibacteria group bacterium]